MAATGIEPVTMVLMSPLLHRTELFALCAGLQEKSGLIFFPDMVCVGDPDGIRTHDLHRDRVAC